jgi:ABC-2 type transport system permease protein
VLRFVREPGEVVFTFAYPIFMLTLFASIFSNSDISDVIPDGVDVTFAQYFLPGMVATGIVLSSFQRITTQIAADREEGALKRLHGTPLPPLAYFGGIVGQVLVVSTVQVGVLLAVAHYGFGVPWPATGARWVTFAWLFVLGTAAGAAAAIAVSSLLRSARAANGIVAPTVLALQFLSGVFFAFSTLASWMQQVAAFFPLKWLAQGFRSVFLPDEMAALELTGTWEDGRTALVLALWLVVSLVLASRFFTWLPRGER